MREGAVVSALGRSVAIIEALRAWIGSKLNSNGKYRNKGQAMRSDLDFIKTKTPLVVVVFAALCWVPTARADQKSGTDADRLLASAIRLAKQSDKKVLVHFGGAGCIPCKRLEKLFERHREIIDRYYVTTPIYPLDMRNGKIVAKRLRGVVEASIPWMIILDGNGKTVVTSDGPNGNIGYPLSDEKAKHFVQMLKRSSKITDRELEKLLAELRRVRRAVENTRTTTLLYAKPKLRYVATTSVDANNRKDVPTYWFPNGRTTKNRLPA